MTDWDVFFPEMYALRKEISKARMSVRTRFDPIGLDPTTVIPSLTKDYAILEIEDAKRNHAPPFALEQPTPPDED